MIRSKLLKHVTCTKGKISMSTTTDITLKDKKLQHYRNLNALGDRNDVKPNGWDDAQPFENIPGPKPLPIIGNVWRFLLPKFGDFYKLDFLDIMKQLHEKYGDISIMSGIMGGKSLLMLFNPQDIEMLYRNEGVWPIRQTLPSLGYYRKSREDVLPNIGLVAQHGEDWFKFRSVINPILMQPRNISQYTDQMNHIADELIDNIKYLSEQNKHGEMPNDFNNELYKWALESLGVVTLDKHLGSLKRNLEKDSEPQKMIQSTLQVFELMYKLDVLPSMWKYVTTPDLRKYLEVLDFLVNTIKKYINEALDKLEKEKAVDGQASSVLQQLVKIDRHIAVAMSVDMMLTGIDTTGRVMAAGLYYLSKNPDKQELLRNEAVGLLKTKDAPVTKEILTKATFLKATVKEVMRLAPISVGNLRTTVKDLVLGGYQIPKGVDILTANLVLCTKDEYFPRAKEFVPERWLSTTDKDLSHKSTNPFIFAPFGYGPRSCIAKRLGTLELEVALLKIIRNFEFNWPHEDMVFATTALYGIAGPLKLHVKSI